MPAHVSRRQLFSRLRGGPRQIRPPWSRPEEMFTDRCTQCDACAKACPQEIIAKGHAGYPIVVFSIAGCTFCAACAEACDEDCFLPHDERTVPPWRLRAFVSDACVETRGVVCRLCIPVCEWDALGILPQTGGTAELAIKGDRCTGCGACVPHCPVGALTIGEDETRPAKT